MWQLTILSIVKSILLRIFLICSSFSSSHVCDFCIGFSCWIISSALPMYLRRCTLGCPCGQQWVFWLDCCFLKFHEFSLRSMRVACLRFEYLQTITPSLALIPPRRDESRCPQPEDPNSCIHCCHQIIGIFSLLKLNFELGAQTFWCHLRWSKWPPTSHLCGPHLFSKC